MALRRYCAPAARLLIRPGDDRRAAITDDSLPRMSAVCEDCRCFLADPDEARDHLEDARDFMDCIDVDPWFAIELPLPDGLDLDGLRRARDIVYAIIHALGGRLDDSLPFIGRLAELDRRISLNERSSNL